MAYLSNQFVDSPVFIYDNKNKLIAKTVVTGFNRDEMYIEVPRGLSSIKPKTRLHLLIIHPAGVSELSGVLKIVRQGLCEISIFGEQQREGRASDRRIINASAVISDMVTDATAQPLSEPIPVVIENISATGVLVKANAARIEPGSLLQIEFAIGGKAVVLYGEVLRVRFTDGNSFEYGCQLHFPD